MKSYLINLASRPDRLAHATEQLHSVGIHFERFEAFNRDQAGGNGPLAFNKSQYYCIKRALDEGHERFAIFEDDVTFTEGASEKIAEAMVLQPEGFGILHLGCNLIGMSTTEWKMPDRFNDRWALLHNCWQTHAIIWSREAAEFVVNNFIYHEDRFTTEGLVIFDEWIRNNILNRFRCYVMRPMVAYQRPDTSDIWGTTGDYRSSFELGNKYLEQL